MVRAWIGSTGSDRYTAKAMRIASNNTRLHGLPYMVVPMTF